MRTEDLSESVHELVTGLLARPWGQVTPSVYETGRLVSLAPWLGGHGERVRYLLAAQRPDGGWVSPHVGYALIPTLSATEALLSEASTVDAHGNPSALRPDLIKAANQGLDRLFRLVNQVDPAKLPDMPAIEHLAPYLTEMINVRLDELAEDPIPGLRERWRAARLSLPADLDGRTVAMVRARLRDGGAVPQKLLHALEIGGPDASRASSVRPEPTGAVGASPAATAAWLGFRETGGEADEHELRARRFLAETTSPYAGPAPSVIPITNFERGWVLGWLAAAGIPLDVPAELISGLRATLGPAGTSGGSGLPVDADTTSGILYTLSMLGHPQPPDALFAYETDSHFCTWRGENGYSVTTNAHVLEAFGHYLGCVAGDTDSGRYTAAAEKAAAWLIDRQANDGSWLDRWHASPYYATACAAVALDLFGGARCAPAVERARGWVLDTQHPDGSWGCWGGTAEETAYALQLLMRTDPSRHSATRDMPPGTTQGRRPGATISDGRLDEAVSRGGAFLRSAAWPLEKDLEHPPLWHDKDLYRPIAVVRAAILAALHLTSAGRFVAKK
ncbi:hypothetical protein F8566_06925 [Actinomadura rudentiformis]|uniref:Squalene cyclase C-terminal domain-containing protein n=1 Tax=Actinomadura rudentiformis TaxID=359158 RepID=A0A6H9Z0K0_9ACTN|nr:hypothetical protein F8566_06925 [Actinomadura rudentiformis]